MGQSESHEVAATAGDPANAANANAAANSATASSAALSVRECLEQSRTTGRLALIRRGLVDFPVADLVQRDTPAKNAYGREPPSPASNPINPRVRRRISFAVAWTRREEVRPLVALNLSSNLLAALPTEAVPLGNLEQLE